MAAEKGGAEEADIVTVTFAQLTEPGMDLSGDIEQARPAAFPSWLRTPLRPVHCNCTFQPDLARMLKYAELFY